MPINAHPDYLAAEKRYLESQTDNEKIIALEDMIRKAPKHKGGENLRKQLKLRLKNLKEKKLKSKKSGKGKEGIKKADMQAVLIGKTNSGKSFLLSKLTNANPIVASTEFTTDNPEIGTMNYQTVQIQIIDQPSIRNENINFGIINSADTLLEVITSIEELKEIEEFTKKSKAKRIIIFNKIDLLSEKEKRKLSETLKSKKFNFILVSAFTNQGIEELKEKIFESFDIIRIYTKEPGKESTKIPIILRPGAIIEDVAKKISKELLKNIKEIKIWGPSSKFPGQIVGLKHILKDKDIVEFKTR